VRNLRSHMKPRTSIRSRVRGRRFQPRSFALDLENGKFVIMSDQVMQSKGSNTRWRIYERFGMQYPLLFIFAGNCLLKIYFQLNKLALALTPLTHQRFAVTQEFRTANSYLGSAPAEHKSLVVSKRQSVMIFVIGGPARIPVHHLVGRESLFGRASLHFQTVPASVCDTVQPQDRL
jgi:hypothetical protein